MTAAERLVLTVAVFTDVPTGQLILVHLQDPDAERATADAGGRGYKYAGYFGVQHGAAKVDIEDGFEGAMFRAGMVFSGMLGEQLKREQLAEV